MTALNKQALRVPERKRRDWSQAVMRDCDFCSQWALTVKHDDGGHICASCCDDEYTSELKCALESAIDRAESAEKRIAELERSETQLINERDDAESALNDYYKAVIGQAPEWSNWFSFTDAIDEIELECRLWRNQTEDVIQLRQRIAELEARKVCVPMISNDEFWLSFNNRIVFREETYRSAVIKAIEDAGIGVKVE